MTQQFFFYPHILDNLLLPETGFNVCQDMGDKRLRLYITARGVKTFFVRRRIRGKDIRIILGNYPKMSIDTARQSVDNALRKMLAPPPAKNKRVLFSRAVHTFMTEKIHRAPESFQKLNRAVNNLWAPLMNKNIDQITADELQELNVSIAKNHGAATANRMREIMRSLYNFAATKNWISDNPTTSMKPVPEHRRINKLTMAQLKKIMTQIKREKNGTLRSAFQMLIFGFMRKSEVFAMNWNDLDLKTYYYKAHPLTDQAAMLLRDMPQMGKWLFPNGRGGHISDPRISWGNVVAAAGLPNTQMNDVTKLLRSELKWSNHPETLRENMNMVLDRLS